jgi:hypothetical protein
MTRNGAGDVEKRSNSYLILVPDFLAWSSSLGITTEVAPAQAANRHPERSEGSGWGRPTV